MKVNQNKKRRRMVMWENIELYPLMPSQWLDMRRTAIVQNPEQRLHLALIEDALRDAVGILRLRDAYVNRKLAYENFKIQALCAEATLWILDPQYDSAISFETCCEAIGLSEEAIREALVRWRCSKNWSSDLNDLRVMSGITTPKRYARFLAQRSRKKSIPFGERSCSTSTLKPRRNAADGTMSLVVSADSKRSSFRGNSQSSEISVSGRSIK
jgi:hypothetical protein